MLALPPYAPLMARNGDDDDDADDTDDDDEKDETNDDEDVIGFDRGERVASTHARKATDEAASSYNADEEHHRRSNTSTTTTTTMSSKMRAWTELPVSVGSALASFHAHMNVSLASIFLVQLLIVICTGVCVIRSARFASIFTSTFCDDLALSALICFS